MDNQTLQDEGKNWWTGYSQQRPCNRCGGLYIAKSPGTLYCKPCRSEQTKENQKAYRQRHRAGLNAPIKEKRPIRPPELCWWCFGHCKPLEKCLDCGELYNLEKALLAKCRQTIGYLDIVKKNAKRAGKDEKEEVKRIVNLRSFGYNLKEPNFWQEMDTALAKYLKKRGYKPVYNGKPIRTGLERSRMV